MYQNLTLDVDAEGIALVTIEVADRSMNVFTPTFTAELQDVVAQIARRGDIRGAVITSGKRNGFLAGADLKDFVGVYAQGLTAVQAAGKVALGAQALRELERCGKPVAAAINGLALGGGYELCLACHHRVLLDDECAVVGLPEVSVGLLPGGGGTQRLPRLLGIERALPLLLSGRHVGPAEALASGLVDAVVPMAQLIPAARRWVLAHPGAQQPWDVKGYRLPGGAGALAPHAGASFGATLARVRSETQDNYPAPLAILSAVYEGTQLPIDAGLRIEAQYFGQLLAHPVARNLMRTMFVNRGAANKRARRAIESPGVDVVGAGVEACTARLARAYFEEGLALRREGVPAALIENATRQASFGIGPLAGAAAQSPACATPPRTVQAEVDTIQQRLLCIPALVAVRCMEERVISDPADADLGAVLGTGYPTWTGGPLSYIETVGLPAFVARCDALADRYGERFRPSNGLREIAAQGASFYPA